MAKAEGVTRWQLGLFLQQICISAASYAVSFVGCGSCEDQCLLIGAQVRNQLVIKAFAQASSTACYDFSSLWAVGTWTDKGTHLRPLWLCPE